MSKIAGGATFSGSRTFTSSGNVTMTNETILIVNKASGAATAVTLPASPSIGRMVIVKDGKGDAATNNITIAGAAGNIDGAANYAIAENYGSVLLVRGVSEWNIAATGLAVSAAELAFLNGVTAGTGTASKAAVLSAGGHFTMPDGGYFDLSTAALAAAGNGQSTYAVVADQLNAVTGADGTKGVALPAASAGRVVVIINTSTSAALPVAPINSGNDAINSLTAGTGVFTMGPGRLGVFVPTSATQWYVAGDAALAVTPAQIDLLVTGVAAGYKLARGESSLDGSNPTAVATGLTTLVACGACLKTSVAPGVGTCLLTVGPNANDISVYAWKPTGAGDCTLIASTGTEDFYWWAIGTG